jgi:hypothetical protein
LKKINDIRIPLVFLSFEYSDQCDPYVSFREEIRCLSSVVKEIYNFFLA